MNNKVGAIDDMTEPQRLPRWRYISWALAALCLAVFLWLRLVADLGDLGFRNVLSYLVAIVGWFCGLVAFMLTTRRSIWLTALLLPIALGALFFTIYRIERVDSEIVPIFVMRSSQAGALPEAKAETSSAADSLYAGLETDYPQFLGKNANATLPAVHIESDWLVHPPRVAWKQPIGKGWSGFAVQGNAAYTMEQRDQEEWVSCYDANTGQLLWHYAIPGIHFNALGGTGPRATPTIHAGRVYAQSAVSELVCLDMRTGERLWSSDLLELTGSTQSAFESSVAWGRSASPVIADDKLIVPLGGAANSKLQTLIAFDAHIGNELWRSGSDQISYSTPVLATFLGQPQLLYISEKKLAAYDVADGKEMWSVAWPSRSANDASASQPIAIDDSHILMSKGYGGGAQLLSLAKHESSWSAHSDWKVAGVLRTKFTSCVVSSGHAFGLSDGILECVDLSTGQRAWKKGRYRHGQVLLVGETLVVTAENGSVVLVAADPKEFRELASLPVIGDVTWNTAALSGNRLLMRNSDEAACVLLPLKSRSTVQESDAGAAHQRGASE